MSVPQPEHAGVALSVGQPAPPFKLPEARGGTVSLSEELQAGDSVLLVFLRHYG